MTTTTPRGVRNCNPGNIRHGSDVWEGMAIEQMDPAFVQFTEPAYGIRALVMTLLSYQDRHGLHTLRQMIGRWAPPADDNDTDAYLTDVCRRTGYGPDDPVPMHTNITAFRVASAIIAHECAGYAYPADVMLRGVALGLAAMTPLHFLPQGEGVSAMTPPASADDLNAAELARITEIPEPAVSGATTETT